MSDLQHSRSVLLDEIQQKTQLGKVDWKFDASTSSAQTQNLEDFQIHIDRKVVGSKIEYKIWVFDKDIEELDSFNASSISEYVPDDGTFSTYQELAKNLHRTVREAETVKAISPAIDKLKSL